MASRAEQLAARVAERAQQLIDSVQDLTDEQWRTICPNEQRTVDVLVHHVGVAYAAEAGAVTILATDGAIPGLDLSAVDPRDRPAHHRERRCRQGDGHRPGTAEQSIGRRGAPGAD